MLNYFQRIDSYKKQLYFQINGKNLDIYTPKVPNWSQNLQVAKDILQYAGESKIEDSYGVLNIRSFAGALTPNDKINLDNILAQANTQLGLEVGENDITKSLGLGPRHFSAIVWGDINQRKPKPVKEVMIEDAPEQTEETIQEVVNEQRRKRNKEPQVDINQ